MEPDRHDNPGDTAGAPLSEPITFGDLPPVKPGMSLKAELWIALRHLMSKKSEVMISIVAVLAVVGVVGSVALVNVVMAVMTGFQVDFRDKILGANAHVVVLGVAGQVRDSDEILEVTRKVDGVKAAAPFVYTEMMLLSDSGHAGVILKGLDPQHTDRITSLRDDLIVGPRGPLDTASARETVFRGMAEPTPGPTVPDVLAMRLLEDVDPLFKVATDPATAPAADLGAAAPDDGASGGEGDRPDLEGLELDPRSRDSEAGAEPEPLPAILIGKELALTLRVGPGSEVRLMQPMGGAPGPMGIPTPRIKRVRVAGVYESGMYEFDNKWTYMANADVQTFMRMGDAYTGIEIAVDDVYRAPAIAGQIDEAIGPSYYARNWQQMNQGIFDALRLERRVSGLVLFSMVIIAALLIVSVLTMTVITKGREIAILRAMGASQWGILRIFIFEGTLIGVVGAVGGTGLGLLAAYLLDWYGWPLDAGVYLLDTLPVVIEWENVVGVAVGAVATCFAATLYPAISAAQLEPVEGLRYE